MGADLITFIFVGPEEIKPKSKEELDAYYKEHKAYLKQEDSSHGDYKEPIKTKTEFKEFVKEFIEFWNDGGARDSNSRLYKTKKIVIAGDMSWGDSPEGYGYQMFEKMYKNNLEDFFGLE